MNKQVSQLLSRPMHVATLAVVIGALLVAPIVKADTYDNQINSLKAQNAANSAAINNLQLQAASYQDAINQLQGQINSLQSAINDNEAQQAQLQQQISDDQAKIDKEKSSLAATVKTMYVDGTPSTLEVLATSRDLSDFVDKQTYRNTIQNQLQTLLKQLAADQAKLQTSKDTVDKLLADQRTQQSQLASTQASQAYLLNMNKSQQSDYNKQISANNSKISSLRAQQAAANATLGSKVVAGDPGHGGYPSYLSNAAQDTIVDPWGMYNRECVSYTAWKVYSTYGYMPYWGGRGNANEWPGDARSAGIPTGRTPQVGSVAIWNVGYYGHAMWVEAVNPDGSIYVSQYNYDYTGHYSEMLVSASKAASFTYIYFGN